MVEVAVHSMKILFICEGNINRSQTAGTVFKSLMPEAEVQTAGILAEHAGETLAQVSKRAVAVMQEAGFDVSSNLITKLTPQMVERADKAILMGPIPGGPVPEYLLESPKLETWDVPDPGYGQIGHNEARDMIIEKVHELVTRIQKGGE